MNNAQTSGKETESQGDGMTCLRSQSSKKPEVVCPTTLRPCMGNALYIPLSGKVACLRPLEIFEIIGVREFWGHTDDKTVPRLSVWNEGLTGLKPLYIFYVYRCP